MSDPTAALSAHKRQPLDLQTLAVGLGRNADFNICLIAKPIQVSLSYSLVETLMADIRNPKLLYLKGGLFVMLGVAASAILLFEHPDLKTAALLAVAIWAFARAYYFAFYVIQHYIDPRYRFAGLIDFAKYIMRRGPATPQDR